MTKTKAWKRGRQQKRTAHRESKRRAVRSAYRPRTTGQGKRAWTQPMSAAEILALYLMPNYVIARASQWLQALRRVGQRRAA